MAHKKIVAMGDLASGGLIAALGSAALLWVIDAQIHAVPQVGADAQVYPTVLAAILVLLGLSIAIGALLQKSQPSLGETTSLIGVGRVVWVVICAATFIALTQTVGFVPSALLAVAGFSLAAGLRNPFSIAALSIGVTTVLYLAVTQLLKLPLPG
jgi:hypothetical protein